MDREIDEVVLDQSPVSLSWVELDVEHHPVTFADPLTPRWVRAWVRFPETVLRPTCEVVAWTDRAVQVRWTTHAGSTKTAWVWASAIGS